ncbi:hypothetical protein [Pantoea rwandensis]|uniref:Uncharacterized protein n=1 Tax=Pantoea rwandensis TaxID=1076550 RepID=A0A1X1CZU8_9GAMM|nr:hypothetical protein [Pantoea rwandensis]ORM69968.1 hypothetical protein HA51_08525 [Pantoea rwandensis]
MKKLTDVINQRLVESSTDHYSIISYRPSNKINSMIDVMCKIYGTNKTSLFHAKISELLANILLSSKETIPLIKKAIEAHNNVDLSGSAIGILLEKEIIEFDLLEGNPYLKELKLMVRNDE